MSAEPRAYTEEEARELFFDHIAGIFRYWAKVEKPFIREGSNETEARMEGLLFSLFVMFDGGSADLPGFVISPAPHPEDEAYHRDQGENWWSAEVMVNDTQLHEIFPWEKLRA